mgnify:CR=1 FL=1
MREQTFEKLYNMKLHGFAQALQEQLKDPAAASLIAARTLPLRVCAAYGKSSVRSTPFERPFVRLASPYM